MRTPLDNTKFDFALKTIEIPLKNNGNGQFCQNEAQKSLLIGAQGQLTDFSHQIRPLRTPKKHF